MKPVLALGLLLLASDPLTLGDLGRAADVARERIDACEQAPSSCSSPSGMIELARAMAVLYAEGQVLYGVADAELAANVHRLAPAEAHAWVGPPPPVSATPWVELVVTHPVSKPSRTRVVETGPAEELPILDWASAPTLQSADDPPVSDDDLPPPRVLRLADVEDPAFAGQEASYLSLAQDKRLQGITMLERIMEKRGRTADYVFRLAELSDEEARYEQMLELDLAVRTLEACDEDWCVDSVLQPDHRGSEAWRAQAIRFYSELESTHPRFHAGDQVVYHLALALNDAGRDDEALAALIRLARGYPQSVHAQDAYLLIGERHFEAGRVFQALTAYEMAFEHPDEVRRQFALYKAAWCQYNLGDVATAYDTLERVVRQANDGATDVHDDLAKFAAEAGAIDRLVDTLEDLGRQDRLPHALDIAARRLADDGKIGEAVRTWRKVEDLAAADGDRAGKSEAQRSIVRLALESATSSGLAQELERMVKDVALDPLARADGETDALAQLLRRAEIRFHSECKSGSAPACGYAKDSYVAHLALQPERSIAAELHYELGELLYRRGNFVEAHRHYETLLALDPRHPKAQFCAEAAIHAADKALAFSTRPTVEGSDPRRLTVDEERLLNALDAYVGAWPTGERSTSASYRAGYLLYEANHLDEARERFHLVIDRAPTSPDAEYAAQLVLDSLSIQKKWSELHDVARSYQALPALGSKTFKEELEAVAARSTLKMADELASTPAGAEKAARAYADFVDLWPSSPLAAKALNNAAVYFDVAGLDELAAHSRRRLLEVYADSEYTPNHLAALGTRAERRGDFEEATRYYEMLADGYPDHTGARDARYSAALFRWADGRVDAAIENYDAFVQKWPDDPRVDGIRFDIVRMLQESGMHAEALARAQTLVGHADPARAMFARLRVAEALDALDQQALARAARLEADDFATHQKSTPELMALLGELRLRAVNDAYTALLALTLEADVVPGALPTEEEAKTTRRMHEKLAAAIELEKAAMRAVESGDVASAEAAWALLGQGYEDVASSIIAAPMPTYLTASQQGLYLASLRDRAWTFEERAVEAYTKVVDTAVELETFGDAVRLSLQARYKLRPDRFEAPFDETLPAPRFVSAQGAPLETEL